MTFVMMRSPPATVPVCGNDASFWDLRATILASTAQATSPSCSCALGVACRDNATTSEAA